MLMKLRSYATHLGAAVFRTDAIKLRTRTDANAVQPKTQEEIIQAISSFALRLSR